MHSEINKKNYRKLLVVSPPRSGFTLLISILNNLIQYTGIDNDSLKENLRKFVPLASEILFRTAEEYFREHLPLEDLIISGEFRTLLGGPKWLHKENKGLACVRKYLGIKGMGDFLLVISLPKFAMDFDDVIHSHYDPHLWIQDPYYADHIKFSSIRNPLDLINSAVFSINALTSEYIQRFVTEDNEEIRNRLALYKLTDLDFLDGLVSYLLEYLREFVKVKSHYHIMRWEDLIQEPEKTIRNIARQANMVIGNEVPKEIWEKMSYKNLTRHHMHNFRKGIIGDWKNHLVNEHLEILKEYGFDEYLETFGYEKIQYLKRKEYTPFQLQVEKYLKKGLIFDDFDDPDLFTFAFNKSNFHSSKYSFFKYSGKAGIEIERSTIKDEPLLTGFVEAIEAPLRWIIYNLNSIYSNSISTQENLRERPLSPSEISADYSDYQKNQYRGNELKLYFVNPDLSAYLDMLLRIYGENLRNIRLRPYNEFAADFAKQIREVLEYDRQLHFYVSKDEIEIPLQDGVLVLSNDVFLDAIIIFPQDSQKISATLMECVDLERGAIIAPITEYYFKHKPLFIISIPKAGTHLLYELINAFGYGAGVVCPDKPLPGNWYCVEYSNSHTPAKSFFIDTVHQSPFGNRHHPFSKTPAIFIYRNPMDIVVSEANYYHLEGKTLFSGYLSGKSFEERLLRLIDDPWLLGSIRQRVGDFIAWLDFPNVIPVSFEELIGPQGGGSEEIQRKTIWSLQLKLHVPGDPDTFAEQIYNPHSPTFLEGQIGNYKKYFTEKAYAKFYSLPQDFMEILGYNFQDNQSDKIPKRAEEFRKRPVIYSNQDYTDTPIAIIYNFLGNNILKYKDLYYAVPISSEINDLTKLDEKSLAELQSAVNIELLIGQIALNRLADFDHVRFINLNDRRSYPIEGLGDKNYPQDDTLSCKIDRLKEHVEQLASQISRLSPPQKRTASFDLKKNLGNALDLLWKVLRIKEK